MATRKFTGYNFRNWRYSRRNGLTAVLIVFTMVCVLTPAHRFPLPVHQIATAVFILFVPGLSLTPLFGIEDPAMRCTVALAISLSLSALVSLVMAYGRFWSPDGALALLMVVSVFGLLAQLRRSPRSGGEPAAP
ncbi:MAG: hypothetical protein ACRDFX_12025 [Chloroflexota bacterium]